MKTGKVRYLNKGLNKIIVEVGDPVPNILSVAEKEQVNLIVVGRKKRKGPKSFVGSHTLQLITRSKFPTLVSKYMVQFEYNGEKVTRVNDDIFKTPLASDWSEPSQGH